MTLSAATSVFHQQGPPGPRPLALSLYVRAFAREPSHPDSAMISGATYVGVPHTVYKGPSTAVASPKSPSFSDLVPSGRSNTWGGESATFQSPQLLRACACERDAHTSRFSGLMSLWTMFMLCRYFRAPARSYTMTLAFLSVYFAEEVMASNKSPPWDISETRHVLSSRRRTRGEKLQAGVSTSP